MSDFFFIMPEILLALTVFLIILAEITHYHEKNRLIVMISLLGLAGAFLQTLLSYRTEAALVFGGTLSIDAFSLFFKLFFILLAMLTIVALSHTKSIKSSTKIDCCILILSATLAMCFVASASHLILIFLSVLFLNLMAHFLLAVGKRSKLSTQVSIKKLIFSAIEIGLLLYAFAILFLATHAFSIYEIHEVIVRSTISSEVLLIAFMFSFLSFCIQIGAFPMQALLPDLLEGCLTPVSSFLSVGFRGAGFALMIRFLIVVFAQSSELDRQWKIVHGVDWTQIVALVSGFTMFLGAWMAVCQKNVKQMLGYLVVSETGFLLMGFLVLDELGIAAILYNLLIDFLSLIGIFYLITFLLEELSSDRLDAFRGMFKRAVPECVCLVIFLLCFVGSPPMPGFIGKFTLMAVAWKHQKPELVVIAIFSMVVGMIAVTRLVYQLMGGFSEAHLLPVRTVFSKKPFFMSLLVPMILVGVFADFVFTWISQSISFTFW